MFAFTSWELLDRKPGPACKRPHEHCFGHISTELAETISSFIRIICRPKMHSMASISIATLPAYTPLSISRLLFINLLCLTVCPQLYTAGRRAGVTVDIISANPSWTVSRDGDSDSKLALPLCNGQVWVSLNTTELLKEASCGAKVNVPAASAGSAASGHGAGSWVWKNWKGQGSEGAACSSSWEKDGCQVTADEVRGTELAMAALIMGERAQSCIHWVEVPNPAVQYKLLVCAEECSNSKPQTKQGSTGRRSLARRVGSIIIILILLL